MYTSQARPHETAHDTGLRPATGELLPATHSLPSDPTRPHRHKLISPQSYRSAFNFETWVGDDLRTCGVVVHRPSHRAASLAGLDLEDLTHAAMGRDGASAKGKVALVGYDGVIVLQTSPGAAPEVVWCGNAAAAVGFLSRHQRNFIKLHGPAGKSALVSFSTMGVVVQQHWTFASPVCTEDTWRGRTVLRCSALNDYAVVLDPLPDDVTPEEARCALAGRGLGAKLAVVALPLVGPPAVIFYNAGGAHGAAPMTGLATLAIMGRLSSSMVGLTSDRSVTYQTKAGAITAPLPAVSIEPDGSITVAMPTVEVLVSPLLEGDW